MKGRESRKYQVRGSIIVKARIMRSMGAGMMNLNLGMESARRRGEAYVAIRRCEVEAQVLSKSRCPMLSLVLPRRCVYRARNAR